MTTLDFIAMVVIGLSLSRTLSSIVRGLQRIESLLLKELQRQRTERYIASNEFAARSDKHQPLEPPDEPPDAARAAKTSEGTP